MKNLKILFCFLLCFMITYSLFTVQIENRPTQLWQPDGTIIDAFVSGDAFYLRFHDKDGYTMTRDEKTNIICWARQNKDGLLESTGYPVHLYSPLSIGLQPKEDISLEKQNELRVLLSSPRKKREILNTPNPVVAIPENRPTENTSRNEYKWWEKEKILPNQIEFQPDGTKVIFETVFGGENNPSFFDRINGFTITFDYNTKFYCWARQSEDGWLQSTGYPVHLYDPEKLGLKKNIRITKERAEEQAESIRIINSKPQCSF